MKVTFLAPSLGLEEGFYDVLVAIMKVAARQLSIDLQVIDCGKSRERMIELGRGVAALQPRPDYVMLPNYLGVGREILSALDSAGIGVFFIVEGLTLSDRVSDGEPRQKHLHWLGELLPDDIGAGYLLAKILTDEARAKGTTAPDGKLHVGILSGEQTAAGNARFQGWLKLKKESPDVVQASFQYAGWAEEPARAATALMLRNDPAISVVWSANDAMAIGALSAIREAGHTPGKDVLVGGIDLGREALQRVGDGTLTVTIGGHCLDGARALLLLFDHRGGRDFEPWSRRSPLLAVTADRAPRYSGFFEERTWQRVRFDRFSKVRQKSSTPPELTLDALL